MDRITLPARADRQAAGGAGYLGTSNFPMAHGPLAVRMCPCVRGALDVGSYGSTPQPGWSRGLFRASRSCWWLAIW